ncbi:MAG: glycosyltransferase N-terminal domain-containing protein, partial [Bacteroidota bacterium]
MKQFWKYLYSFLVIPLFWASLRLLGLLNRKVRRGIRGRSGLFDSLRAQVQRLASGKRVWFHSSSLGEFEQAKPIIAELKRRHPDVRVIASFFSPSGYEHSKKYPLADVITYLPFDTQRSAREFIDIIRPHAAVMVRYDVWPNHIWELERRRIPALIANATMRRQTRRRIPVVRGFHHYIYNALTDILTVSCEDAEVFGAFDLTNPTITTIGDTRYDQVSIRSAEAKRRHIIPESILAGKSVIVAGSTWPEDENAVVPAVLRLQEEVSDLLLILVPHEPTLEHIDNLEGNLQDSVLMGI